MEIMHNRPLATNITNEVRISIFQIQGG